MNANVVGAINHLEEHCSEPENLNYHNYRKIDRVFGKLEKFLKKYPNLNSSDDKKWEIEESSTLEAVKKR